MARMLARVHPPWCGTCRAKPAPDCWDKRQVRNDEKREVREILAEELAGMHISCQVGGCIDTIECGGPVYVPDHMEGDPELVLGSDC
jgi:hypothetical protein